MKRTPLKRSSTPLKRTPLKKGKPLKKEKKATGEKELFEEIWNTREHRCESCGKEIWEAQAECFSHIKPKGLYPELRLDPDNIELLCASTTERNGCHYLWEHNKTEYYARRIEKDRKKL